MSALTILELPEHAARHATYYDFADHIRDRFMSPDETLHELFRWIVVNVAVSNTDDHVRAVVDLCILNRCRAAVPPQCRAGLRIVDEVVEKIRATWSEVNQASRLLDGIRDLGGTRTEVSVTVAFETTALVRDAPGFHDATRIRGHGSVGPLCTSMGALGASSLGVRNLGVLVVSVRPVAEVNSNVPSGSRVMDQPLECTIP